MPCSLAAAALVLLLAVFAGAADASTQHRRLMQADNATASPGPLLHGIFGSGMVLPVSGSIFGAAPAGAIVYARLENTAGSFWSETAVFADSDNRWSANLQALRPGGPFQLNVVCGDGRNVTLKGLYVGDVYLLSGQSNADQSLGILVKKYAGSPWGALAEEEIAAKSDEQLKLYDMPWKQSATPLRELTNDRIWLSSGAGAGNCSALGVLLGRQLRKRSKRPIGIVGASYTGTSINQWVPIGTLPAVGAKAQTKGKKDTDNAYNAMIAPLAGFDFAGVVWYQGENNAGINLKSRDPLLKHYADLLAALLSSWRARLGAPALPFHIVQLPDFQPSVAKFAALNTWATLREAQRAVAANDTQATLAVTIDIGNATDLHPPDKWDVAARLATNVALSDEQQPRGRAAGDPYTGSPIFVAAARSAKNPDAVALTFSNVGAGGLRCATKDLERVGVVVPGNPNLLKGFEVQQGGEFRAASARISAKDTVVVTPSASNAGAGQVTSVQYAWADVPDVTLYGASGEPAGPFQVMVA